MTSEEYLDLVAAIETLAPYVRREQGGAVDWPAIPPQDMPMMDWAWRVLQASEPKRGRKVTRIAQQHAGARDTQAVSAWDARDAAFEAWWAVDSDDAQALAVAAAVLDAAQAALVAVGAQSFEAWWDLLVADVAAATAARETHLARMAAEQRAADELAERDARRWALQADVLAFVQPGIPFVDQLPYLRTCKRKAANHTRKQAARHAPQLAEQARYDQMIRDDRNRNRSH